MNIIEASLQFMHITLISKEDAYTILQTENYKCIFPLSQETDKLEWRKHVCGPGYFKLKGLGVEVQMPTIRYL